jgi:hypothetical protein
MLIIQVTTALSMVTKEISQYTAAHVYVRVCARARVTRRATQARTSARVTCCAYTRARAREARLCEGFVRYASWSEVDGRGQGEPGRVGDQRRARSVRVIPGVLVVVDEAADRRRRDIRSAVKLPDPSPESTSARTSSSSIHCSHLAAMISAMPSAMPKSGPASAHTSLDQVVLPYRAGLARPTLRRLAVVVHRQPEQDREHEQRPSLSAAF